MILMGFAVVSQASFASVMMYSLITRVVVLGMFLITSVILVPQSFISLLACKMDSLAMILYCIFQVWNVWVVRGWLLRSISLLVILMGFCDVGKTMYLWLWVTRDCLFRIPTKSEMEVYISSLSFMKSYGAWTRNFSIFDYWNLSVYFIGWILFFWFVPFPFCLDWYQCFFSVYQFQ